MFKNWSTILLISVVLFMGLIIMRHVLQSDMKREINSKDFISLGDLKLEKMEKLEKTEFRKKRRSRNRIDGEWFKND